MSKLQKLFDKIKPSTKYVSKFVYTQRLLSARIVNRLIWDSSGKRTYVKSKHGVLK